MGARTDPFGQFESSFERFARGRGWSSSRSKTVGLPRPRPSPDGSPGSAAHAVFDVNGGGIFEFEIANAVGTAGALDGWDMATVAPNVYSPSSAELILSATAANKYTIVLTTRVNTGDRNAAGAAANRVDTFFAMFGTIDANNSYTAGTIGNGGSHAFVDPGSLFQFSDAFGASAMSPVGLPAYNVAFDSNLDGSIDPGDLFAFSDSFGFDWVF